MSVNVSLRHTIDSKISGLRSTFQDGLNKLEDVVSLIGQVISESESCKTQLDTQVKLCESGTCSSAESLKKMLVSKDKIIQQVACSLLKLNINNNKDDTQVRKILQLISGETTMLTPPKESPSKRNGIKETDNTREVSPNKRNGVNETKNTRVEMSHHKEKGVKETENMREEMSPDKGNGVKERDNIVSSPSYTDVSFNDESVSEIEGTPTGRTSPIIHTKKSKNTKQSGEKKKCPDNWCTPEKKNLKLCIPTPPRNRSTRLRQSRFNVISVKRLSVVDLTCSPELVAASRSDSSYDVKLNIKREPVDNDETIMPSPTSGPCNYSSIYKSTPKESPSKFKKPLSLIKVKKENESISVKPEFNIDVMKQLDNDVTQMENSINLLNPNRYNHTKKHSSIKAEHDSSISLVAKSAQEKYGNNSCSPTKRPLVENINVTNLPHESEMESSISLLRPEQIQNIAQENSSQRKTPEKMEAVYKEPTVRNKAEKRVLPGWSCEECKNFYAELYKDNYEMLKKKMEECSRHRGRNNPARPKTPPGFWDPRWTVPDDTEEFNRRNNAV